MSDTSRLTIFLDVGGVMIDPRQRSAEWGRLIGDWFAPLLGGAAQAWSEANRLVVERLSAQQPSDMPGAGDFVSFARHTRLTWMREMCALVGVPLPAEDECLALAADAAAALGPRVRAAIPGAVEAIRTLHREGYSLHTASGSSSLDVAGSLEGMEVRECFGRLYGADLINTFKDGPEYYARIFADTGIAPAEALVVDDSPQAVVWAASIGARIVLVSATPHAEPCAKHTEPGAIPRIAVLAKLPAFLTFLQHAG